ncbi:MAG: phage holin family protein [Bacteroidales bacterium]|nr:phage holin family protein [Bacteroidales bacterium]
MKIYKINLNDDSPSPRKGRFWIKVVIMSISVLIASYLFNLVQISSFTTAIISALVISLLNSFLKPILKLLSAPLILMSFGLFQLFINAFIILLTSRFVSDFRVESFSDAFWFSIVITIINFLLELPNKIQRIKKNLTPQNENQIEENEEFTSYEEVEEENDEEINNK